MLRLPLWATRPPGIQRVWRTPRHSSLCKPAFVPAVGKEIFQMTPSSVSTKSDAKRIVKVAISLLYFLSQGLSRFISRAIGRAPDERLVIMYYHGVSPAYRANFVRQLEAIRRGARVWPACY